MKLLPYLVALPLVVAGCVLWGAFPVAVGFMLGSLTREFCLRYASYGGRK